MARRATRQPPGGSQPTSRPTSPSSSSSAPDLVDTTWAVEAFGALLFVIALITLLSLLTVNRGSLTDAWALLVRRTFGWASLPATLIAAGSGVWLMARRWHGRSLSWDRLLWLEALACAVLALIHLPGSGDPIERAFSGQGGGLVGYALAWSVATLGGRWLSALVWLIVLAAALVGITGQTPRALAARLAQAIAILRGDPAPAAPLTQPAPPPARAPRRKPAPVDDAPTEPEPAPPARGSRKGKSTRAKTSEPAATPVAAEVAQPGGLPPLDLLELGTKTRYREDEIEERKRIIEETLDGFGVPARVVSVSQGPTFTQFGIEPGFVERRGPNGVEKRKIKVSKILSLSNDLALALAAPAIRMEAPVPGRSVVGLEVPNADATRVALRNLMESPAYQRNTSPLRLALGEDVRGQPIVADLRRMPHLLIAGATGSGKSVGINAIIACLLFNNTPDQLKLLLVDPKRVELIGFNGIPHLVAPVVVEMDEVVGALHWATREMERRYQLFAALSVRNIEEYNRKVTSSVGNPLPYTVIIIDELADLMMVAAEEAERLICRLAQMARATGIHLILATQRPSTDVVTGLIKANFPARIAFAVTSQIDSRVILDGGGAEKLMGRGDMLYMASDAPSPKRLQGAHVTDRELEKLVKFWRRVAGPVSPHAEPPPWEGMSFEEDAADEKLIEEAAALVREYRTASASLLQRRLRIGYPRAARLIDELEARGVVGPAQNGRSRPVLYDDEEPMDHLDDIEDDTEE